LHAEAFPPIALSHSSHRAHTPERFAAAATCWPDLGPSGLTEGLPLLSMSMSLPLPAASPGDA
jgi:hypothetical protein